MFSLLRKSWIPYELFSFFFLSRFKKKKKTQTKMIVIIFFIPESKVQHLKN